MSSAKQKDTEASIKNAALKLFSEKGFHQTSTTEITRLAGVGKGSLYWYWKSKEDLAFSLVSEMLATFLELLEIVRDSDGPAIDRAKGLAKGVANVYEQEKEQCRLLWKFRADNYYVFTPEYQEKVMGYYKKIREAIAALVDQGIKNGELRKVDSNYAAFLFLGVTEGLEVEWLENEEEFSIQDGLADVVDMVIEGLRK